MYNAIKFAQNFAEPRCRVPTGATESVEAGEAACGLPSGTCHAFTASKASGLGLQGFGACGPCRLLCAGGDSAFVLGSLGPAGGSGLGSKIRSAPVKTRSD